MDPASLLARLSGAVPAPWMLAPLGLLPLVAAAARHSGERFRRGARVLTGFAARRAAWSIRRGGVSLAGVRLSLEEETRHFKILGATGTGKSTAIAGLLAAALARGDRAVITDPDGLYTDRFHDARRGDVILNPFDPRSLRWDPFAEVRAPWDAEQLAASLVPNCDDPSGREWRGYARTFLAALIRRLAQSGCADCTQLWQLLMTAPAAQLAPLLAGTPAQPLLEPENSRMFGSLRSVAGSVAAALEFVDAQRAAPFSVRRWIAAGRGVLFLPYQAAQIAALRTIISTWVRLAIFEAMQRPALRDQRLWFVVDELDALGQIDGLKDALARLRKFGGRCVLGFQSVAQVSSTYGAGEAGTIVENCGNTLILRCSASEQGGTAQFAARLIGEREVLRRQRSRGSDRAGWPAPRGARRSLSVSDACVTEQAVLPAQIEQLPDLTGYLKTAHRGAWLRVRFRRP